MPHARVIEGGLMYQVSSRVLPEQPTLVMVAKMAVADLSTFLGKAYGAVAQHAKQSAV